MRDVRNDVGILSETIGGLGKIGRTATFAVSAPLAVLGSQAVQAASDFDGAMRNINSIAGMSEQQLQSLSQEVLRFGQTTRGGAVESANALYTVFSAGLTDTALAMETMKVATVTAEAGLADMETTTEALVASMLSYGTETMSATRASDALTAMVQVGVGSMQNFANSVANALPAAASLGIEIEDLYGAMAFMTQRGFSAAKASTSLNSAMTALVKPTERMEGAMASLGVNGAEQLIEKYGSLGDAIKAVVETTDGSGEAIAELFSNVRGKRFVDLIASDFEAFEGSMKEFDKLVDGATTKAHEEQMKSFAAQWDLMTSAVEGAAIAIGQVLLPVLTPVVQAIADIFTRIAELNPVVIQMGVAFASAVTLGAPLLWLFATLLNPIGLLIGAASALGVAFVSGLGDADAAVQDFVNNIPALGNIQDTFNQLYGEIQPPSASDLIPENPTTISANEFVKIQSGDTVWDFFIEDNGGMTWNEFKAAWKEANGTLDLFVGDLVEVPTGQSQVITDEITEMLEKGMSPDQIASVLRDREEKAQLYTSDFYQMNTDTNGWSVPMEMEALQMRQSIEANFIPAIAGALSQVKTWIDTNVGAGLEWLGSLFAPSEGGGGNTGGNTPVYNAVKSALEGDIVAALNAIAPSLGTKVQDFLVGIFGEGEEGESAFPRITAALNTLFTNVSNWILTDAIPTLSRTAGLLGGKFAVMLYDAFSMVGDFLSGGGAEQAVGNAANYLEDGVVNPIADGFNDAIAGTEFEGFITQLFSDIENLWNTLDMPMLVAGIEDFADGVVGGLTALAGADWSGIVKIIGFFSKMSVWFASGFLASVGGLIEDVGLAIGDFVNGISALLNGDIGGALDNFTSGIFNLGFAIVSVPLHIFDAIAEGIANLLGMDFTPLSTIMDEIQNTLTGEGDPLEFIIPVGDLDQDMLLGDKVRDAYANMTDEVMTIMESDVGFTPNMVIQDFRFDSSATEADIQQAINGLWEGYDLAEDSGAMTEAMQSQAIFMAEAMEKAFQEKFPELDFWDVSSVETPTQPLVPPPLDEMSMYGQATELAKNTTTAIEAETANQTITPLPTIDDEPMMATASEMGTSLTEVLGSTMMEEFLNGDMSPQAFFDTFLLPFKNNWVATFGEGSEIQSANTSFMTSFGATMMGLVTQATITGGAMTLFTSLMSANVTAMSNVIVTEMTKAKGAIATILEEIAKLASVSTNLQIKVEVSGEINAPVPDGSHATGLGYVPNDGYIAELHKGEMVLPASIADDVRNAGSVPSTLTGGGTTTNNTTSNTQNTVIVDGDVGVDAFLEELERRGIYLK